MSVRTWKVRSARKGEGFRVQLGWDLIEEYFRFVSQSLRPKPQCQDFDAKTLHPESYNPLNPKNANYPM